MLSTIKPKTTKTTTPKTSAPKTTKKCDCKDTCKKEKCECKKEQVEEAETEATGEELRSKVFNSIENVFKSVLNENNKIEMRNIEKSSSPCYFVLITLKTRDTQTTDDK
jgi:hypothetical protein